MTNEFKSLPRRKMVNNRKNITVALDGTDADLYRVGHDNGWDVSEILRKTMSGKLRELAEILRQNAEQYEHGSRPA